MMARFSMPGAAAALLAVSLCLPAAAQEQVLRIGFLFAKESQLGAGAKRMADDVAKQTVGATGSRYTRTAPPAARWR